MAAARRPAGDGWEPEPWGGSFEIAPRKPAPLPVERVRPPVRRPTGQEATDRSILGLAVTHAVTAIVAFGASLVPALNAPGGWPLIVACVVIALGTGIALSRDEGATLFTRGWVSNLVTTIALLPIAALAVALARQPHVALTAGSAWAPILFTLLVCFVLAAMAVGFGVWSHYGADEAGLLVLPAALVVPALIGIRGGIEEADAARALGLAAMVAAIAALMSWSLAPPLRVFAPPAAIALQVFVLWLTGQGPSFTRSSGQIVPLLFTLLFIASVLVVVGATIVAIIVRHLEQESRPFGRELHEEPERFRANRRPPLR